MLSLLPAASAASPTTYLTTSLVASGPTQTTISGFSGVLVTYTNHLNSSFIGIMYLSLMNTAGQTVGISIGSCNFAALNQSACFIVTPSGVASGTYLARVLLITPSEVPIALPASLQVKL